LLAEEKTKSYLQYPEGRTSLSIPSRANAFNLVTITHHYQAAAKQLNTSWRTGALRVPQQKFIKNICPEATIWVSNPTGQIISLFSNLLV